METRERQYGVECFENLSTKLENKRELESLVFHVPHKKKERSITKIEKSMGIFVDIKSDPVSSPSASESDIELAIRRSVDEELALSDDDSSDDQIEEFKPHRKSPSPMRVKNDEDKVRANHDSSKIKMSNKSDSEQDDTDSSDDDLRLNYVINKHNMTTNERAKLPVTDKPRSRRSSCSSDSSGYSDERGSKSPFSCQYCQKIFRSNADLTRHVRCHTGERPYTCEHCSKSFSQSAHLRRHLLTHPDKASVHKCPVCDKSYPLKIQLIGHMAVHSKKDPVTKVKTKFKCDYCQKIFDMHHKYKTHMLAHMNGKLHCCDVCGRSFKMQSYLIVHKRTHTQNKVYTGDRPFVCAVCGKAFLSSSNLELHSTIHKYERTSFPCEICGKEFSRKSNYVAHTKSHYR